MTASSLAVLGLVLSPPCGEGVLSQTVRSLPALEDHVAPSLELDPVAVRRHRLVVGVLGILIVDDGGHALHRVHDLLLGADAVVQPVGNVLRADPQRRPVLHQLHVVDVRNLGAPHAVANPPDDVPKEALDVVVELHLHLLGGELAREQGDGEDVVDVGHGALGDLRLSLEHVDLVVVEGVERGRRGRGSPRRVGARHRVADLLLEHLLHVVGSSPHALADLATAGELGLDAAVHVVVLVPLDPGLLLDLGLGEEGTGLHARVDLVARAVEEACVDEDDALLALLDALAQVDCSAPLLVHDAHLEEVLGEAEGLLGAIEELHSEGDLLRAVHLGLDEVGAAGPAVDLLLEVVRAREARDHGVEEVLRDGLALRSEHRVRHEVEADVAHEQHHAPGQHEGASVGRRVGAVVVHRTHHSLATLLHLSVEGALHEAEPVAVRDDLVLSVDGSDRVLAVRDGGECRLGDNILDARLVRLAHGVVLVDQDVHVEAVVDEEYARHLAAARLVAGELRGVLEARLLAVDRHHELAVLDRDGRRLAVRPASQGEDFVEDPVELVKDLGAPDRVVRRARGSPTVLADGISAVEGIQEGAPAGVGGVQDEASIVDGAHELGPGDLGDLRVDVGGFHLEAVGGRQEVADRRKERLVLGHVRRLALVGAVPLVELLLEIVALSQEGLVFRPEVLDDLGHRRPKSGGIHVGAGSDLIANERCKLLVDLEAADVDTCRHQAEEGEVVGAPSPGPRSHRKGRPSDRNSQHWRSC
mmetsp:Transcript_14789/g.36192  ORF Transcript_14789/g.36192 Transcript_14789/m.36192 type:complete len:759 (-) Transcript_14789:48-2324(-)